MAHSPPQLLRHRIAWKLAFWIEDRDCRPYSGCYNWCQEHYLCRYFAREDDVAATDDAIDTMVNFIHETYV
jgi:hypothetical protein